MRIFRLEGSFRSSLLEELARDPQFTFLDQLQSSGVFRNLLLTVADATHVIIEYDYFDADTRSSASMTLSRRHNPGYLTTHRLVFFQLKSGESADFEDPIHGLPRFDSLVDSGALKALGYILLTSDSSGLIGRSLLPAPATVDGVDPSREFGKHVRASVVETIAVAGKLLSVKGVPFMKQDGNILACAHVSAWMAHYASVLRGLARRRHTADFATLPGDRLITGRSIPSSGLTAWQMASLFERIGLPADVLVASDATRIARTSTWYDRSALRQLSAITVEASGTTLEPHADPYDSFESVRVALEGLYDVEVESGNTSFNPGPAMRALRNSDYFWTREAITTNLSRQLNSGFPAVVVDPPHAFVVNGYLRWRDIDPAHPNPTEVAKLICSDDQEGPYVLKDVSELADRMLDIQEMSILLPLPPGVWLRGDKAERLGMDFFHAGVMEMLEEAPKEASKKPTETSIERYDGLSMDDATLKAQLFEAKRLIQTDGGCSVRSYVVTSTDFKRGLSDRKKDDPVLTSKVRLAKLPKFVWVIEVMKRDGRDERQHSVIGEVVLDASSVDQRQARALITHLPGLVQVCGRGERGNWHVLQNATQYQSGRYHSGKDWHTDPESIVSRWKYSV